MDAASLTAPRVELEGGGTALRFPWNGEDVLVRDDSLTALRVAGVFADLDMPEVEKPGRVIPLLFADPDEAFAACDYSVAEFGRLIGEAVRQVYGIDTAGGQQRAPLWDPEEDAAVIRTSLRMAYGIDWDADAPGLPWAEFVALVWSLPRDTPMGARIWFRNPENRPKRMKHNANKAEIDEFDRLHRAFRLKQKKGSHNTAEASNAAMNDLALAVRAKMG